MPVPFPNLDDRSYQDLVDEMLARIPAHTPEWTNPAPGDPGRTLLELFAWLTDTLLYRVNLVPRRQRLAFLRLLGETLRPGAAARTLVSIQFDNPDNTAAQVLPPLTRLAGAAPFETRSELTVLPVLAEAYCKRRLSADETQSMAGKIAELTRLYPAAQNAAPYVTTPVFPAGKADPAGFDLVQATVDHCLWIALLAPKAGPLDAIKATLGQSASGGSQYLNVAVSPLLAPAQWNSPVGTNIRIPHTWELSTPDPTDPANPAKVAYLPLTPVSDTSNGLATDGIIRLPLPGAASFQAPVNDVRADVDAGTGDKPPRLDDPQKALRLVAWLRLRPTTTLDSLVLTWVGVNGVEIDQRQTTRRIVVGQGTGQPDLQVQLPSGNVETDSFQLEVEEAGRGFLPWSRIDDLLLAPSPAVVPATDAAVADPSAVFEFDPEAGTIVFGDGVHGKIPARGARIRAALMRTTNGAAGNLPAGSLTQVQPAVPPVAKLKAWQPLPARAGADAETLEQAEKRIPALFRHRDRAVTADDYREIALATPGAAVARAEVLPGFKPLNRTPSQPDQPGVPGVVSVMVLPSRASLEPPNPRVDRPFLELVYQQLGDRKPLGTELYVIGCDYVRLALAVGIDNPGGIESVNAAVKDALQRYLAPLPPYGPSGQGWPLGRKVRRRELEVVVSRVDGVEGVDGPNLFLLQDDGTWQLVPNPGDNAEILLAPWQLPELIGVVVADGDAPTTFKPPASTSEQGVAIPVVPEVC